MGTVGMIRADYLCRNLSMRKGCSCTGAFLRISAGPIFRLHGRMNTAGPVFAEVRADPTGLDENDESAAFSRTLLPIPSGNERQQVLALG